MARASLHRVPASPIPRATRCAVREQHAKLLSSAFASRGSASVRLHIFWCLRGVPGQDGLHRHMNPALASLRSNAFRVQPNRDATVRHPHRLHPPHPGDNSLLVRVFHQQPAAAEVPTKPCVAADWLPTDISLGRRDGLSFLFSDAGPAWFRQVDNLRGLDAFRRLQTYVQEDFLTTELAFHEKFRRLLSHPRTEADLRGLEFL
jgi:hypothetical protein